MTCYVYRLFRQNGRLLYVGSAFDPSVRINQHRQTPWGYQIHHAHVREYDTEEAAREVERKAIREEKPLRNVYKYKSDEGWGGGDYYPTSRGLPPGWNRPARAPRRPPGAFRKW
jgi:predicted GIY-YIG superfamily endonuclease